MGLLEACLVKRKLGGCVLLCKLIWSKNCSIWKNIKSLWKQVKINKNVLWKYRLLKICMIGNWNFHKWRIHYLTTDSILTLLSDRQRRRNSSFIFMRLDLDSLNVKDGTPWVVVIKGLWNLSKLKIQGARLSTNIKLI